MKYKVTLNGRTYEVEVEAGKAMCLAEYEAIVPTAAPVAAAPVAAPAAAAPAPAPAAQPAAAPVASAPAVQSAPAAQPAERAILLYSCLRIPWTTIPPKIGTTRPIIRLKTLNDSIIA